MPRADSFKKVKTPFLYYRAYKGNRLIGYCFDSINITPEIKGYAGPIEIAVAVDTNFNIVNLKILHHIETPKYAAGITKPAFLGQFKGKGFMGDFNLNSGIDAISGATVSSQAICDIIKTSLRRLVYAVRGDVSPHRTVKKKGLFLIFEKEGLRPKEASYYKVLDE
jgi:electron transport complex protein RnfG